MIQIGVQTGGIEKCYRDVDDAYRIIKEAGFEGVDANVDHLLTSGEARNMVRPEWFNGDDRTAAEAFRPWRDGAKKYGLENFQAHAPFPTYLPGQDGEYNEYMLDVLRKTIIGCDYMDCRRLVIHPFFTPYDCALDPQKEWEVNIERYSKLIPTAKQYGVTVCLENMFTGYRGRIYAAVCSDITTACNYVDELNRIAGEKTFGFCVDTGHLLLCSLDIKNTLTELGDRVECFHVHDNNGLNDQHLAPYMGVLDWKRFVEGLREINFDKPMCFETFNIWNTFDHELCPEVMKLIARTGRMFAQRAAE